MMVVIGVCLLVAFLGGLQVKRGLENQHKREETIKNQGPFEKKVCSKSWMISQGIFVALCIVGGIYIYFYPESLGSGSEHWIGYEVLFVLLAIDMIISAYYGIEEQNLYYNKEGFIQTGDYIRFKQVKELVAPGALKAGALKLYNKSEEIKMPKERANAIKEVMIEKGYKI